MVKESDELDASVRHASGASSGRLRLKWLERQAHALVDPACCMMANQSNYTAVYAT